MFKKEPLNIRLKKEAPVVLLIMLTIGCLLSCIQLFVKNPLLLLERFFHNGGWIEIGLAMICGAIGYLLLYPRQQRTKWRLRLWLLFSIVFFSQLLLGITIDSLFLMTGKLHFPIPALIPLGAIYRMQISFMPILFLVSILLTSGAWCSQLCYFGVYDALAAGKPTKNSLVVPYGSRRSARWAVLSLFILFTILLRLSGYSSIVATVIAALVGLLGLFLILRVSRKKGRMFHCSLYCPAGTLVTLIKKVSPWRFGFNDKCTKCMACTRICRYDALQPRNVLEHHVAPNCTLCGDCLSSCVHGGLEYRIWGLKPETAERLWLATTIVFYVCFLFIARI